MPRHKLVQEGPDVHPSKYFYANSVHWKESQPYAIISFTTPEIMLGHAVDFQRDEEGWISADMKWDRPEYDEMSWDYGVHLDPTGYFYGRKQRLHVTECWVTCILVAPNPGFPLGIATPRE